MGDILYNNMNFPDQAAARAASARTLRVATMKAVTRLERLGSHAALGGRGGRSSASTMRVVVMARLTQCARSGRCSWRFATIIILAPHPKNIYILGCRTGV